jgi:N-dimethylarginine dimethylaminohydrolase
MTSMNNSKSPATYGGEGWQVRENSLGQEINEGRIWHPCGSCSEWGRLREVVLSWPGEEINFSGPANDYLMLARPHLSTLQRQTEALVEFYQGLGVTVHLARPSSLPPPNFLFMRDLFWATPEGVVLARPASHQRAGEERYAAETLAKLGVPMILSPHGLATFEGADALWLNERTVLLGVGGRTNNESARQLRGLLGEMDVELREIRLPQGVQHLLGVVNFVDRHLAVLYGGKATPELIELLAMHGVERIVLPPDDELCQGLGMNFVTLSPRRIVMPANCPRIKKRLVQEGIEVLEMEVSEYLKAAGGLACLTGILWRE